MVTSREGQNIILEACPKMSRLALHFGVTKQDVKFLEKDIWKNEALEGNC